MIRPYLGPGLSGSLNRAFNPAARDAGHPGANHPASATETGRRQYTLVVPQTVGRPGRQQVYGSNGARAS